MDYILFLKEIYRFLASPFEYGICVLFIRSLPPPERRDENFLEEK